MALAAGEEEATEARSEDPLAAAAVAARAEEAADHQAEAAGLPMQPLEHQAAAAEGAQEAR